VSEEIEGQDTGADAVAGGVDPAAVALALGGASREEAGSRTASNATQITTARSVTRVAILEIEGV
jgi:hypothetical protein